MAYDTMLPCPSYSMTSSISPSTAEVAREHCKWTVLRLAAAFGLLLIVVGLRGASEDSLIYLAVTFSVLGFAGYEAWRWYVRRKNPVPKWK